MGKVTREFAELASLGPATSNPMSRAGVKHEIILGLRRAAVLLGSWQYRLQAISDIGQSTPHNDRHCVSHETVTQFRL